jgi:hypothetical protein
VVRWVFWPPVRWRLCIPLRLLHSLERRQLEKSIWTGGGRFLIREQRRCIVTAASDRSLCRSNAAPMLGVRQHDVFVLPLALHVSPHKAHECGEINGERNTYHAQH